MNQFFYLCEFWNNQNSSVVIDMKTVLESGSFAQHDIFKAHHVVFINSSLLLLLICYDLFIHSPTDGHLRSSQFGGTVNNVYGNILMQILW